MSGEKQKRRKPRKHNNFMLNNTVPAIHTCSQCISEFLKAAQTCWVVWAALCCPFLSLCLFLTAFIQCAECSHTPVWKGLLIVLLVNTDYVDFCWICASLFFFLLLFFFLVVDYMCLNIERGKINATCQRETGSDKCGSDPGKQTYFGGCYN